MIDTRQVRENDRLIFESLGDDISQYLTNNKFTDNAFELELFLDIHFITSLLSISTINPFPSGARFSIYFIRILIVLVCKY